MEPRVADLAVSFAALRQFLNFGKPKLRWRFASVKLSISPGIPARGLHFNST